MPFKIHSSFKQKNSFTFKLDKELRIIVRDIFGGFSLVHKKVLIMNYWNSKLRRKTPFPTPDRQIDDRLELAKLALKKMCCDVDVEAKIQKYDVRIDFLSFNLQFLTIFKNSHPLHKSMRIWITNGF